MSEIWFDRTGHDRIKAAKQLYWWVPPIALTVGLIGFANEDNGLVYIFGGWAVAMLTIAWHHCGGVAELDSGGDEAFRLTNAELKNREIKELHTMLNPALWGAIFAGHFMVALIPVLIWRAIFN